MVDYSIRKAWEAFFHLDFDYSYVPDIRTYVPGLSVVRIDRHIEVPLVIQKRAVKRRNLAQQRVQNKGFL